MNNILRVPILENSFENEEEIVLNQYIEIVIFSFLYTIFSGLFILYTYENVSKENVVIMFFPFLLLILFFIKYMFLRIEENRFIYFSRQIGSSIV